MANWPHSPPHRLFEPGAFMITGATVHKQLFFRSPERLSFLHALLLDELQAAGWRPQAWAVFPNHYHVVAMAPESPDGLRQRLSKIHTHSAAQINREDGQAGRQVWFQFWDSAITFHRSYFARLRYVHENPVHHGVVARAADYEWGSAGWLEQRADPAYRNLLETFKIDQLQIQDAY